jgi:hypothetical protein
VISSTALRGAWAKVEGVGYRQSNIKFVRNRAEGASSGPYMGAVVNLVRVDGAIVQNNHQDVSVSPIYFVSAPGSTSVTASGNTGANIRGQMP